MTDQTIGVSEDAQATVASFQGYDPGLPSGAELQNAQGVDVGPAWRYITYLRDVGEKLQGEYVKLNQIIDADCEVAARAIAELHDTDADNAAMLNVYYGDEGANAVLTPQKARSR